MSSESAEPGKKPNIYTCRRCKKTDLKRNEVYPLLEDPSMDWQGDLNLHCQECYAEVEDDADTGKLPNNKWQKVCRNQWERRQANAHEKVLRMKRVKTWHEAIDRTGGQRDGESSKVFRQRVKQELGTLAALALMCMPKLSPKQSQELSEGFVKLQTDWERKKDDPEFVPEFTEKDLTDFECQHISEIMPGVDDYYLCRKEGCLMVCRNTDWPNTIKAGGGQYYCPACAQRYQPWLKRSDNVLANPVGKINIREPKEGF